MAAAIDPGFTHVACWKSRGDLMLVVGFELGFSEVVVKCELGEED